MIYYQDFILFYGLTLLLMRQITIKHTYCRKLSDAAFLPIDTSFAIGKTILQVDMRTKRGGELSIVVCLSILHLFRKSSSNEHDWTWKKNRVM